MSRIRPLQRRSAPPQDQRQDSFRVAGEAVPDRFLSELGARVRTMRAVRGMSRKVLAQTSGVSERYIAQLESGQGNVSIMLLRRLAEVAGVQLEDLVADPAGRPKDWVLIRELLMQAPPVVIDDVKALLTGRPLDRPTQAANIQVDRVALIGLRGAGKSTLGRLLAEQLGWRFVELNREIERDAGFSVSEVFSLYGQDAYRRFEQAALARIVAEPGPMVHAVGGGIVSDPVTFERLLAEYFCIWIKASPTEHMERVRAQGDVRPMADDSSAMSELVTILKSREALYARARASLDTSGARVEDSVQALLRMVRNYCAAGCPYVARNRIAAAGANGPVCETAAER